MAETDTPVGMSPPKISAEALELLNQYRDSYWNWSRPNYTGMTAAEFDAKREPNARARIALESYIFRLESTAKAP